MKVFIVHSLSESQSSAFYRTASLIENGRHSDVTPLLDIVSIVHLDLDTFIIVAKKWLHFKEILLLGLTIYLSRSKFAF